MFFHSCEQVVGPSSDIPGLFPAALNGLSIADVTPSMRAALLDAAARLRLSLVLRSLQRLQAITLELDPRDASQLPHGPPGSASSGSGGGGQQTELIYALSPSLIIEHPSSLRPGLLPPSSLPHPTPSLAAGHVAPAVRRSVDVSAGVVSLCFNATSAEGLALFWAALHRAATACDARAMRRLRPGQAVPEVGGGGEGAREGEAGKAEWTRERWDSGERIREPQWEEGRISRKVAHGLLCEAVISVQMAL